MTVLEYIEKYGYEELIALIGTKVYVIEFGGAIMLRKLTGVVSYDDELVFQINYHFLKSHIFLTNEDAKNFKRFK